MRHIPLYHLSFDGDLPNIVEPRVPNRTLKREDNVTPRLSVSDSILGALNGGYFFYYTNELKHPLYIYSVKVEDVSRIIRPAWNVVEDAAVTGESWVTGPGPIELTKIGTIASLNIISESRCYGTDLTIKVDTDVNLGESLMLPAESESSLSIRGVSIYSRGIAKLVVNDQPVYVDMLREPSEERSDTVRLKDWSERMFDFTHVNLEAYLFSNGKRMFGWELVNEEPKSNAERDKWNTLVFSIDKEFHAWMTGETSLFDTRLEEKAIMLLDDMSKGNATGRFFIDIDRNDPWYAAYLVYEVSDQ